MSDTSIGLESDVFRRSSSGCKSMPRSKRDICVSSWRSYVVLWGLGACIGCGLCCCDLFLFGLSHLPSTLRPRMHMPTTLALSTKNSQKCFPGDVINLNRNWGSLPFLSRPRVDGCGVEGYFQQIDGSWSFRAEDLSPWPRHSSHVTNFISPSVQQPYFSPHYPVWTLHEPMGPRDCVFVCVYQSRWAMFK